MAIDWKKILCSRRLNGSEKGVRYMVSRSPFKRDYGRVLYSSAFRRLQDKTQVFPIGRNDYVRTRLTHSLEVANVGSVLARTFSQTLIAHRHFDGMDLMQVGKILENIDDIVITVCLAHDIGNPPFGHSGEDAINAAVNKCLLKHKNESWVKKMPVDFDKYKNPQYRFEGNAQGLRLLVKLCDSSRENQCGLDLTAATLAAFIKYPCTLKTQENATYDKAGVYEMEAKEFGKIAHWCDLINEDGKVMRHPLAYLMEAADDISYVIADIEDAYASKIIDYQTTIKYLSKLCDSNLKLSNEKGVYTKMANVRRARSNAVNNCIQHIAGYLDGNIVKLLDGSQEGVSLIESCGEFFKKYKEVKEFSKRNIYSHEKVLKVEVTGFQVISYLIELFFEWVITPRSPLGKKLQKILHAPDYEDHKCAERFLWVIDYVSGMTDSYALHMYQTLGGFKSR